VPGTGRHSQPDIYTDLRPEQQEGFGRKQKSNLCLRVQTFEGDSDMTRLRMMLNVFAVSVVCLICSSVADAQATRTWVSGVGDDANPCSRTAPCKTFAGAISKTATGGEIDVLDPGGFGAVNITKSLTIDGTTGAGFGSILSAGVNGVIVNAPAGHVITLRNLSINGARCAVFVAGCTTAGINGIRFIAGGSLHVQNVNIFGFSSNGIDVNLTATGSNVTVQDSTIRECAASGVSVTTTVGTVAAVLNNVQIDKNANGVSAAGGAVVTIRNSNLALNSSNGINTASGSQTNADNTLFSNNGTGINVAGGATARLNSNTFANNLTGVANSGTVQSGANNKFLGNTTAASGNAFGSFTVQ
jgi:hypothetical protein